MRRRLRLPLPAAQRKLISPFRGDATVEFTKPVTKRAGANIVTTIVVKNTSPGPLAGFRLEESWSDSRATWPAATPIVIRGR